MKPLILLSNDDGYDAAGIIALRQALLAFAEVVVCAPASNQSATSHKLTLTSVLRLQERQEGVFAVDGTPADCVYVALHSAQRIIRRRPDLVVSGMNHGPNLGVDVVYSGTVAAAREAANRGIPSVAVSASMRANFGRAAALGAAIVQALWHESRDRDPSPTPLLSVNIPAGEGPWPVAATRPGRRLYDDEVVYRRDPRGREYLWIGGKNIEHERADGTDTHAWEDGVAGITPLSLNLVETSEADLCARLAERADHR
ncbi:MAG: 5'/3'-nucleotidase SurE [Myxococcota bacterium]